MNGARGTAQSIAENVRPGSDDGGQRLEIIFILLVSPTMTRIAKINHFRHHLERVAIVHGGPVGRAGRLGASKPAVLIFPSWRVRKMG